MRHKRFALVGIALLAAVAACSNSQDSGSAAMSSFAEAPQNAPAQTSAAAAAPGFDASAEGNPESSPDGNASGSSGSGAGGKPGSVPATAPGPTQDRQVIKTADVQLELTIDPQTPREQSADVKRDAVAAAAAQVSARAGVLGGFVGSLEQSGASATMVLRVPVDKYDALLTDIRSVAGKVTRLTESAQDVTAQVTDAQSRIASLQTSVDRLRTLLSEAVSVADIISIESELTSRQSDLESWQGQLKVLSDQVGLSTISVTFTAVQVRTDAEPIAERSGFTGGLANGWDAVVSFATWVAVVVGTFLPFAPLLLVAGLALYMVRRSYRKRQLLRQNPGS
ncbi:DUF4349 domain-containing protein [Nakamurella antarctica]|uniref:DUF4349 domain-containing protein n=1 Tax=Nakamurella antarctica TaxID=1902245 RepID=A0A3G8ZNS4_9ACTN|nr:DUF4349 domain-containing protein [Nakamurella antarctica]AZI58992.1 DUF4349 domain-containing protein [Nakamurella antarctica]